jgi:hypothetical protein
VSKTKQHFQDGVCYVCAVLDTDESIKPVKYCAMCGVWMCTPCEKDLVRRGRALKHHVTDWVKSKSAGKSKS